MSYLDTVHSNREMNCHASEWHRLWFVFVYQLPALLNNA